MGLTFITPAVFISSLVINLLFLNLPGVLWLLARDGLPVAFILFLIHTVYSLFLEMGDRETIDILIFRNTTFLFIKIRESTRN